MFKLFLLFSLLFQEATVAILSPQAGETLRGQIQIQGKMDVINFERAELSFAFDSTAADEDAGWFAIQTFSQPTADSALALWDTTALTDGDYALRLRVFLADGSRQDSVIRNLQIRNDEQPTPAPTQTPFNFESFIETPTAFVEQAPVPTPIYPTSTPLPPNPAALTSSSIVKIFWQSAAGAALLFLFFSLVLRLRK
ncbi:MAG: hypothetical protein LC099_02150 [Anaerolineales bacterium]|nr:hypothetical protein [Anaerolineales bacterium]